MTESESLRQPRRRWYTWVWLLPWPLACAHWRGLLLGRHPHLWTELFPPLLGTVRSVQVSAQGQLMRCEYVKLYPLSQGSYKHWSLGQNMRNLVNVTNSAADMIPAGLASGWWSHLLVWGALKHGTLHVTRRKKFGAVNNNIVYSSHAHEHEGGVGFYNNNTYVDKGALNWYRKALQALYF